MSQQSQQPQQFAGARRSQGRPVVTTPEPRHTRCAGVDVHPDLFVVQLREERPDGTVSYTERRFNGFYASLIQLAQWLFAAGCRIVGMESTGVYWFPLYRALQRQGLLPRVANPRTVKAPKGRKSDSADAQRIADATANNAFKPSVVPTPEQQELRGLMRQHEELARAITQTKNRIHKVLREAGVALRAVFTHLFDYSGRRVLELLATGEHAPESFAAALHRRSRHKRADLLAAVAAPLTAGERRRLRQELALLDILDQPRGARLMAAHAFAQPHPAWAQARDWLDSIPGAGLIAAYSLLGELGLDMSRWPTVKHLASWAGMCPGQNESAGHSKGHATPKGNPHLRWLLTECGHACARAQTPLGERYRRLAGRPVDGARKIAAVATGHHILTLAYTLLKRGEAYDPRRAVTPAREGGRLRRLRRELEAAGYAVTAPAAVTPT